MPFALRCERHFDYLRATVSIMNTLDKYVFIAVALLLLAPLSSFAQRTRYSFDDGWQFHLGDIAMKQAVKSGMQGGLSDANVKRVEGEEVIIAYTDRNKTIPYKESDWQDVNLPHDWLVETSPVRDYSIGSQPGGNGFHPGGVGFYRKEFDIPDEARGKRISLEFDGISRCSTVWVNGHLMGHHESGYTPSFYELSEILRYGAEGKNVLLVKVDATDYEGWWYEGAGIYRHTWLVMTDPVHVKRFGTFVTTPEVTSQNASVNIETTISNESDDDAEFTLESIIYDGTGKKVASATDRSKVRAGAEIVLNSRGSVSAPKLWSPDTPNLYSLETRVLVDGKAVDSYETTFGIRTVEVRKDGFYLNGKLCPVKGTANHQDHAGIGVALPDKMQSYRLRLLKEMGSNGYRSAHNPPTVELLDACDSLGFLVLDENRHLWASVDGLDDLRTLVLRDRNHPSIFMWCIENEENIQGTEMGARIAHKLVALVRSLDPTRQITAAINHAWNDGGYADELDVVGYNYGQRGLQYCVDHEKYPDRLMFATESTSFVSTRGEYKDDDEKGYMSNFGKGVSWGLQPGEDWKHVVLYPYLSGTFVWTGFDYRGEPTPYSWPCVSSHFGILDLCGFPKDGYYGYKAAWTDVPVVHVYPHWNLKDMEGQTVKMGIYTNCEEVELRVNGKSLGRRKAEAYERLEWDVVYKPGKIEVRGYNKGKLVAKEINETSGPAATIVAESDVRTIKADGRDLFIVNYTLLDKKGHFVPDANEKLDFTVSGPGVIIGTGNGDPSCHDPEKVSWRKTFNGHCQVIVQSTGEPGVITLEAAGDGLVSAAVSVNAEAMREIHVSTSGDDRNNGASYAPLRTLEAAVLKARSIKSGEVRIILHEGVYRPEQTIVLTPEDGNADKKLIIENHNGEEVTLSGAVSLNCNWKDAGDGILRTSISGIENIPEMLSIDGNLRTLARYPNYDPKAIRFNGVSEDATSAERVKSWSSPKGAYLHAMHPADWGDFHYRVTGALEDGTLETEGGWQNNRPSRPSRNNRMIENVREELDSPGEWFYDSEKHMLYYMPVPGEKLSGALTEVSRLKHIIEFRGSEDEPVRNITLKGVHLTLTERTFMEKYEPLLRSDWTIYRGAAVFFEGTEGCSIQDCDLYNLGGNAVMFSGYNRTCSVSGCHIHHIGASAVCFVGDPSAVRSPSFNYSQYVDLDKMDRTPGPANNLYPRFCSADDNLIHNIGMYEKQVTGIELSMCSCIEVDHNTIYNTPRAALNISEGAWGGHHITNNDLFDTVRETGDHGSINAWGRDRFWHPDRRRMDEINADDSSLALLDAIETVVIEGNRVRCDRGWDIDLDDGATNYLIRNNLCLCGGIKLREGFHRTVENNILVNSTFHPHVWFKGSGDVFTRNVVMAPYEPVNIDEWGKLVDKNIFTDKSALDKSRDEYGTDAHSSYAALTFADPVNGDYTVTSSADVLAEVGFVNFDMDGFGVVSARLKALAARPEFTLPIVGSADGKSSVTILWNGLRVKTIDTMGEQSATGMDSQRGVYVVAVFDRYSKLNDYLRPNDVILAIDGKPVNNTDDLLGISSSEGGVNFKHMEIFRNQASVIISIDR